MTCHQDDTAALSPYRVLDLTEGGCLLTGKLLADLGAEVIKIEKPGGSPSRIAPFYKDIPHPEKSLFWFAYNTNKKGITLDLEKADGREIFKRLVKTADVVIDSFQPGYLDQLGLGYAALMEINPTIILTSITLFGQTGPKAQFVGSDLTAWASGGYLYLSGTPDRPPVWVSFPQAGLLGGAEAATGTMSALWYRQATGEGQQVDVSIQECVASPNMECPPMWDLEKIDALRLGLGRIIPSTGVRRTLGLRCKDGDIAIFISGGSDESAVRSSNALVKWMDEEGVAPNWLKQIDWRHDYSAERVTQDFVDRVEAEFEKFTLTKTKAEIYEEGLKRRILTAPMCTAEDTFNNAQLRARDYWVELDHPELHQALTYCGPAVKLSESPMQYRFRAPLIGEHNEEIYERELGVSKSQLSLLKQAGVI